MISIGWLARIVRRERRAATGSAPVLPLPMAASRAAASVTPQPLPVHLPVLGGESSGTGAKDHGAPHPRAQPVAGDPPVEVPDRRAKGRAMRHPEVTLMPEGRRIEVAPGTSLLEVARADGLEIQAGCGMGLCGCDPVSVPSGMESLSPAGEDELGTIARLGLPDHTRMACCARVLGDVVVSLEPLLAARSAAGVGGADGSVLPDGSVMPAEAAAIDENGAASTAAVAAARLKESTVMADAVRRVVILGNGIAGVTAADHIRRHHSDCEIDLVTEERHPFYNRTGVSRLISSRSGMHRMYLLPEAWYEERRITSWLNTKATSIDAEARLVRLGTGESLSYDRLILATGSSPLLPPIEGLGLEGSFALRTADDGMAIRAYVQREECRSAVVVGGGVLALEAADMLSQLGLAVTVVERASRLAPTQIDARGGRALLEQIKRREIDVLLGTSVDSLEGEGRVTGVKLDDGSTRGADLVIVCAGVSPRAELAREAGLEVNSGVVIDDLMRTSDPAIYAAGDVVEHSGRTYGLWPSAVEQGEAAAINALGARRVYSGSIVPTHLKMTGVDLTSIGPPQAQSDAEIEIVPEGTGGGSYRKLVISEGAIIGAILLGRPRDAAPILAAIREQRDVRGHLAALRRGEWDVLSELHFEQAVVAPLARHRQNGNGGEPSETERTTSAAEA